MTFTKLRETQYNSETKPTFREQNQYFLKQRKYFCYLRLNFERNNEFRVVIGVAETIYRAIFQCIFNSQKAMDKECFSLLTPLYPAFSSFGRI